ncbi:amino acid/polyamine transporter I [Thamnidium elegans]|nr:amino acid/polyamine transporter I [Thamnidium elegans]
MSYITGYIYLTGFITGSIALAYSIANFIVYIGNTLNEDQITSQGASIGIYCAIFIVATGYNFLGMRCNSYLNKFMVFWIGTGTITILCTVPAMAPKLNSAKWVFTEFTNNTGYESVVMVFFVGMLQAGWCLSGYVCGAHIVEGTKRADVTAPRGIIICITGVIVQGLVIILITLFSIQDINELIESKMPISTFFLRATSSPQLTAFFLFILLLAQFGSLCNTLLATSHLVFALAREGCLPFSSYFSKLSEKNRVPERALLAQLAISILLIMPNFASVIYWQAIMSAAIISTNIAYGIPFLCRLIWMRNDMPRGPFSLGRFGLALNFISVVWISFFSIILCIPSVSPVTSETMNWASVMIGGVIIFSLSFWFISGRKNYGKKISSIEKQ